MPMQWCVILSNLNSFIKFFLGSGSPKGKIIFPQKLFGKFVIERGGTSKLGGGVYMRPYNKQPNSLIKSSTCAITIWNFIGTFTIRYVLLRLPCKH
jgi:hypothetical protein